MSSDWRYEVMRKGKRYKAYRYKIENILGYSLPKGAIIHHIDGDEKNDSNENLVVCENHNYHMLLHMREKSLKACGHADWRKCRFCKKYDSPKNLYINTRGRVHHRSCDAEYHRLYRKSRAIHKEVE
jgi:hypothetical protein